MSRSYSHARACFLRNLPEWQVAADHAIVSYRAYQPGRVATGFCCFPDVCRFRSHNSVRNLARLAVPDPDSFNSNAGSTVKGETATGGGMRAVLYETFQGPLRVVTVPDPVPPRDGVVVQVHANGICRSDWHGWMGHDPDIKLPHVPGHELAGVVVAVGPDTKRWRPGDRVTVPFALGCGGCEQCLSGNQQICDSYFQPGFTAWGSFAEFVALPHADVNLVRLPEWLEYVAAASLGCRFVTAYRAIVQQGQLTAGKCLAVHGCGGVGLAAIMIAHAMGALPIAVDVREEALEFARELGAVHLLNAGRVGDVPGAIRELTGGGAHVSIDALGSIDTCRNSVRCLRKQSRHVQVGLMLGSYRDAVIPMDLVIARELQILGSHGLAAHAYAPLLQMIQAGRLQPGRLVQTRIGLEEAPEALIGMGTFRALGVTVIDRF